MPYVTSDQSLPRSLDVQISLSRAQAESRTRLDILCVACQNLGFLHDSNRIRFYSSIAAVELDFAAGSEAHFAASAFFGQTPRPTTMAIGEVFLSAQHAMIVSPALTAAQIATVEAVSAGSFQIGSEEISGLDFTDVASIDDIVDVINGGLGSDTEYECINKTLPDGTEHVCLQTILTGDLATITEVEDFESGTYVGVLLGLTAASGASVLQGYTPTGIADELSSIANAAEASSLFIYGWALGASLRTIPYQTAAAAWALARTYAMMGLTTNSADAYNSAIETDIGFVISATGNRRVFLNYHNNAQRYPEISTLAYMLSVNYRLADSTVTAKFKVLPGIETVPITETQLATLQSKGYNVYTSIGNDSRTYREGITADSDWWIDTVINLDNFVEDLSVNVFNVFLRNKKIPYTRIGQQMLADACRDTGYQYTYNGTFADREEANTSRKSGVSITPAVQVLPTPISNMSAADRASRIGPPIEMVCQEAGAIHSIALNVEIVS